MERLLPQATCSRAREVPALSLPLPLLRRVAVWRAASERRFLLPPPASGPRLSSRSHGATRASHSCPSLVRAPMPRAGAVALQPIHPPGCCNLIRLPGNKSHRTESYFRGSMPRREWGLCLMEEATLLTLLYIRRFLCQLKNEFFGDIFSPQEISPEKKHTNPRLRRHRAQLQCSGFAGGRVSAPSRPRAVTQQTYDHIACLASFSALLTPSVRGCFVSCAEQLCLLRGCCMAGRNATGKVESRLERAARFSRNGA